MNNTKKSTLGLWIAALLFASLTAAGQTRVSLSKQTKDVDFAAAVSTRPFKTGATLPASCQVGELFFKANAPVGQNIHGCTSTDVWTQLGGTNSVVTSYSLTDCGVTLQGAAAVVNTPCRVSLGGVVHEITAGAVATLSGASASGTVYFYWDATGHLVADENTTATATCNGLCQTASTGGFPAGVTPIAKAMFTNNVFSGVTDLRAFLSNRPVYCGTGLTCIENRNTGELTVAADTVTGLVMKSTFQGGQLVRCVSTSMTSAHTCSLVPALLGYATGMVVEFNATAALSGAATLNIDGLGARPVKRSDGVTDPGPGEVSAGLQIPLRYDGAVFRLPLVKTGGEAGTFASLPVCAASSGAIYLFSDSLYQAARCGAPGWEYFYDGRSVTPPAGSWSWDNQTQTGSASIGTTRGFHELQVPATHASGYAVRYQAAPTSPYTRTWVIRPQIMLGGGSSAPGYLVGFRETATGKLHGIGPVYDPGTSRWLLSVVKTTSATVSGTDFQSPLLNLPSQIYLRIADDSANLKFSYSADGYNFHQVASVSRTAYLAAGPGQLFFAAAAAGAAPGASLDVISIQ